MLQDDFFILLNNLHNDLKDGGSDGYLLLKFTLPLNQLLRLYEKMEASEIPPIEMLTDEQKQKYWKIARGFYDDKETAIKASKAAYMLDLISGI